jgi:hypothetical protein
VEVERTLAKLAGHGRFPVRIKLIVGGVAALTSVDAELTFDEPGNPAVLKGVLFGPSLGILLSRDDRGRPQVITMADYNKRYWARLETSANRTQVQPRKFPVVDRFIAGDDDATSYY